METHICTGVEEKMLVVCRGGGGGGVDLLIAVLRWYGVELSVEGG